jgi:hypothetical protein
MKNHTLVREPSLQRLAEDFDALSELVQTLIDHDRLGRARHEAVPCHETEFTTEWQMESTSAEVYSG